MKGSGLLRIAAVSAAGAGLVWGAGNVSAEVDLAQRSDQAVGVRADAPISRVQLTCAGPDRPGVEGLADDGQAVTVITASTPPSLLPSSLPSTTTGSVQGLAVPGAESVGGQLAARGLTRPVGIRGARGLDLTASGSMAPGFTATQVGLDAAESAKGLTMVPCAAPAATSYLLAGGNATGRAERLVLTNPSPNPVPVRVTVLGAAEPRDVVVAGHGREVLALGSIDDAVAAPVVRVSASRGTIAASLVESEFAGAVPQGTDAAGPALAPARTQLIPAVRSVDGGSIRARVGVPGPDDAVVRLSVIGPDGAAADDVVRTVSGSSSRDIDLPTMPAGDYALRVSADVPVVTAAASRTTTDAAKAGDVMWVPAARPVSGLSGIGVPNVPGGSARLVLGAADDTDRSVQVTTVDSEGATTRRTVTVAAGETSSVDVTKAAAVWIRPTSGPVTAALVVSGRNDQQPLLAAVAMETTAVSAKVTPASPSRP